MWEEFTGGAHPSSYYTVLNFNPETGEEIVLSDLLKEEYEEPLINILINNLAKQLQVDNIDGIKEKGYLNLDTDMFVSNNFILDKEQIIFIYNKYEIAPYALGDIMINVTYNELKKLLDRAAETDSMIVFFSHNIYPKAPRIHMPTEWLEEILQYARKLNMNIVGTDQLKSLKRK